MDISIASAWVAPNKNTRILSDTSVRRSAVDRSGNHTRNQKKGYNSLGDQQAYCLQVFYWQKKED